MLVWLSESTLAVTSFWGLSVISLCFKDTPLLTISDGTQGRADFFWLVENLEGYAARFTTTVETAEGLILTGSDETKVFIESGRPTAFPGGPYRGGIAGGDFSPIQFEGNLPGFVEAEDIGEIINWQWFIPGEALPGEAELEFDGTPSSFAVVSPVSNFPSDAITVGFWMKTPRDDDQNAAPFSYIVSDLDKFFIHFRDNEMASGLTNTKELRVTINGEKFGSAAITANDGEWHYITVTWERNGGNIIVYNDGAVVEQGVISNGTGIDSDGTLIFGQHFVDGLFNSKQSLLGKLDDVSIWSRVLTPDEIRFIMNNALVGNESDLVSYWSFNEGAGNVADDLSGNGNVVHLENTIWCVDNATRRIGGVYNPTHAFAKAGTYEVKLRVQSEFGKTGSIRTALVTVVDGKMAGNIRAADLRTPVEGVTLTSPHVDFNVLAGIAMDDSTLSTVDTNGDANDDALQTQTDVNGFYKFEGMPLGNYLITPSKMSGNNPHDLQPSNQAPQLTLNAPNQLAVDSVNHSVFPMSGRIVYSLQRDNQDVLVDGVKVKAQAIGGFAGTIESVPSTDSPLIEGLNGNYSLPLFTGNYHFLAERPGHIITIETSIPG